MMNKSPKGRPQSPKAKAATERNHLIMRLRGAYQLMLEVATKTDMDATACLVCIDKMIESLGGKSEMEKRKEELAARFKQGGK
jgi:hypothetical protein